MDYLFICKHKHQSVYRQESKSLLIQFHSNLLYWHKSHNNNIAKTPRTTKRVPSTVQSLISLAALSVLAVAACPPPPVVA